THVALYFGWYLLEHYNDNKEIRDLLNNSALYLVPVVNPDGLVHNATTNPTGGGTWRKNRSPRVISTVTHYGTDLNRNYGHKWAYSHPGQLGQAGSNFAGNGYYRGTAPWSEAETQAIRNLCNSHRFVAAFNYHAWDDSFNYPWNFDIDSLTNDSLKFSAIAAYCTEDNYFEKGTFDKTLGYTANGTSDDWLYGEQTTKGKIFAFTIEVGKSFWPAQGLIITYCDSLLQANIKMLRMAAKYAAIEEISSDTISTLSCHAVYNLKRYSIKDTGFTVSVIPLDANITATGTEKLYTAIPFLGSVNDSIQFSLSPSLPNGTIIRFLLKVDNGAWFTVDTISKVYINLSTLPLSCESHIVPGNSSSQAIPIIPGVMTRAAIESKEDEDWFYFQNTIGQKYIRIVLSDLPADYDIELFDAAGQRTGFSSNPYKINDTIVYNSSYVGDFRLHVYGYKKTYHPFRCYSITAELGSDPFTEITYAALKETGNKEVDLSIFPIPAGSHVSVSVKTERAGKLNWYLTDNTGRQLLSGSRKINRGASMFSVDISMLLPGFYLLNFVPEAGTKRISFKIIKE
ncbi:MAG TPA: M14 family zinc carboxypeptidase, partial [Chitinophagaceae bacterium]